MCDACLLLFLSDVNVSMFFACVICVPSIFVISGCVCEMFDE